MPLLLPCLCRHPRPGQEFSDLWERDTIVAHVGDRLYHPLLGHVVNPVAFDCFGTIPRIRRPSPFLALPDGDAGADQSRPDGVFGAEKFTGNLQCTEPLNDVFLVEQTRIFVRSIIAKRKKISYLLGGAEKLGIGSRWPTIPLRSK